MNTPWGESQTIDTLAPGILDISTAGHGGIFLDQDRMKELDMISPFLLNNFFEEDCDWCIPFLWFNEAISQGKAIDSDHLPLVLKAAAQIFKYHHKEIYQQHPELKAIADKFDIEILT